MWLLIPLLLAAPVCEVEDQSTSVFRLVSRVSAMPLWETDYGQALRRAKAENAVVLVHVGADWCPPCIRMERDVLHKPEIAKESRSRRIVLLKLDMDDDKALLKQLGVRGPPHDLIIQWSSRKEKWRVRKHSSGAKSLEEYLSLIKNNSALRRRSPAIR